MKTKLLLPIFIFSFLIVSCKEDKKNKSVSTTKNATETEVNRGINKVDDKIFNDTQNQDSIAENLTETEQPYFKTSILPAQKFTINTLKDTVIKGGNGTQIIIPVGAFSDVNGNIITDNITIELKEALSMTDMVMGGLTTLSDWKLLESDGMVYINATLGSKQLYITKDKQIEVSVPTKNRIQDMQIFKGEVNEKNNTINWVNPKDIAVEEELEIVEIFPVDELLLYKPIKPEKDDGTGNYLDIEVKGLLQGNQGYYSKLKWKLVENKNPDYKFDIRERERISIKASEKNGVYIITVAKGEAVDEFKVKPVIDAQYYEAAMKEYKKAEKEYLAYVKSREAEAKAKKYIDSYVFPLTELGWVNCDIFYNDPNATEVALIATIQNNNAINKGSNKYREGIYVIFENRKIIIKGDKTGRGRYVFGNIGGFAKLRLPLGEKVKFIAYGFDENDKLSIGITKAKITKTLNVNITLAETNKTQLKKVLDKNLSQ